MTRQRILWVVAENYEEFHEFLAEYYKTIAGTKSDIRYVVSSGTLLHNLKLDDEIMLLGNYGKHKDWPRIYTHYKHWKLNREAEASTVKTAILSGLDLDYFKLNAKLVNDSVKAATPANAEMLARPVSSCDPENNELEFKADEEHDCVQLRLKCRCGLAGLESITVVEAEHGGEELVDAKIKIMREALDRAHHRQYLGTVHFT